jgi:hypothetical protein
MDTDCPFPEGMGIKQPEREDGYSAIGVKKARSYNFTPNAFSRVAT